MLKKCCSRTKRNQPCPIPADRQRDRLSYCHVHDPEGAYQQQIAARRRGETTPMIFATASDQPVYTTPRLNRPSTARTVCHPRPGTEPPPFDTASQPLYETYAPHFGPM